SPEKIVHTSEQVHRTGSQKIEPRHLPLAVRTGRAAEAGCGKKVMRHMETRQLTPLGLSNSACHAAPAGAARWALHRTAALVLATLTPGAAVWAQTPAATGAVPADSSWRRCAALTNDNQARLAC